jgi:hypothetical protein
MVSAIGPNPDIGLEEDILFFQDAGTEGYANRNDSNGDKIFWFHAHDLHQQRTRIW